MDVVMHAFALIAYPLIGLVCVQRVVEYIRFSALLDYDYFVMSIHIQRRSAAMMLPLALLLAGWPIFMVWAWYHVRQHNIVTT